MLNPANDNDPITFFSVCSGIEAATVAWTPLGWKCVGVSEIEKFPSAVLGHHYPDVKNHGDFTTIDVKTLPRVDILCGGTPCQAFSVAGLRRSLDDARGNLSLSFVRLAHELSDNNGLRNAVWENVPGVLSTKDNAFGCFLGALVGADDAVPPPAGRRWPDEGMVSGPKGRAAWSVLDAQYFGLAQRRKRVILVADFGNGADPAAVLLEFHGLSRNPPTRGEAGKDIAPTISARTKGGGGLGTDFDLDGGVIEAQAWSIMPQNSGKDYKARPVDVSQLLMAGGPTGGNQGGDYIQQPIYAPEIARCVATREGSSQDYETTTMVAVGVTGDIAHTLKAEGADASEDGTVGGTPIIAFSSKDYGGDASFDLSPTLRAGGHSGSHANAGVMPAIAFVQNSRDEVRLMGGDGQIVGALAAEPGAKQQCYVATHPAIGTDVFNGQLTGDVAATMGTRGSSTNASGPTVLTSAVRRLTPTECERLQGFPDGYTDIPWRGKPTSPDGPRYKALGNSWAVPKFTWLGRRIAMHMPARDVNTTRSEAA